jgi:cytochrome c biogenesis factor
VSTWLEVVLVVVVVLETLLVLALMSAVGHLKRVMDHRLDMLRTVAQTTDNNFSMVAQHLNGIIEVLSIAFGMKQQSVKSDKVTPDDNLLN